MQSSRMKGDDSIGGDSSTSSYRGRRASQEIFLSSTATTRRRNESDQDFLARVTHLRLQNKSISSLGDGKVFSACPSLKVLYLYDNCVESLEGLASLRRLEQLHADNNLVTCIEGTFPCGRIRKLHLSGNNILTLRGLESARSIEELYIASQRVPAGQRFSIDHASINGIKASLLILDASGNDLGGEELEHLLQLSNLETLNLADNDIEEISQVVDIVTSLNALRSCDLRGNLASRQPKYFERAVTRCGDSLRVLDGKTVHFQHRAMLRRLDQHKRAEARKGAAASACTSSCPAPVAEVGVLAKAWATVDETVGSYCEKGRVPAPGRESTRGSHSKQSGVRMPLAVPEDKSGRIDGAASQGMAPSSLITCD